MHKWQKKSPYMGNTRCIGTSGNLCLQKVFALKPKQLPKTGNKLKSFHIEIRNQGLPKHRAQCIEKFSTFGAIFSLIFCCFSMTFYNLSYCIPVAPLSGISLFQIISRHQRWITFCLGVFLSDDLLPSQGLIVPLNYFSQTGCRVFRRLRFI